MRLALALYLGFAAMASAAFVLPQSRLRCKIPRVRRMSTKRLKSESSPLPASSSRRPSFVRLSNLKFARHAKLSFPSHTGTLQVPDHYLLEDYQHLLQGVGEFCEECVIEGTIPRSLRGSYFITGPGILQQNGKNVHPFDGHGLIRKFAIDGRQGTVSFSSKFVRTPAFVKEAREVDSGADALWGGEMPLIFRGLGTNTNLWDQLRVGNLQSVSLAPETFVTTRNPSNTCIIPIGDGRKLLSLFEGGLPCLLDAETLETIESREDFDGALKGITDWLPAPLSVVGEQLLRALGVQSPGGTFLAHTRYDASANLLVGLAVTMGAGTSVVHVELDADTLQCVYRHKHSFSPPFFYIHDFVITKNTLIIAEVPMAINPWVLPEVALAMRPFADAIFSDPTAAAARGAAAKHPRVHVIPRRMPGVSDSISVSSDHMASKLACAVEMELVGGGAGGIHHVQAYENDDGTSITLESCVFPGPGGIDLRHPFGWAESSGFWNPELQCDGQTLTRFRIDLGTKRASGAPLLLSPPSSTDTVSAAAGRRRRLVCDFPSTHPNRHGHKCRYMYTVTSRVEERSFPFQVLVKVDLDALTDGDQWEAPARCFLGEPLFVPATSAGDEEVEEDCGWVLLAVYHAGRPEATSSLVILDAQNLSTGPVAQAHLRRAFPLGFHTNFAPLME